MALFFEQNKDEGTILNDRFINERDPFVSEFRFDPRRWNVHCSP